MTAINICVTKEKVITVFTCITHNMDRMYKEIQICGGTHHTKQKAIDFRLELGDSETITIVED